MGGDFIVRYVILLGILASFQVLFCQPALSQKAEQVLNRITYELPAPSIIGKHEWKELQLDRLVTMLDRTTTSFGRWGLVQLLHPIADQEELSRRKDVIAFLVEHEDVMRTFQKQLKRVHEVEESLLTYWDKHDQLNSEARQFYYTFFGLKDLNKSSLALNASTILEMFNSWKYLVMMFAGAGILEEYRNWRYGGKDATFSLSRGLKSGFKQPLTLHYPYRYILPDPESTTYTYKDSVKVWDEGSWGDRWTIAREGYDVDKESLGSLAMFVPKSQKWDPLRSFLYATMPVLYQDYVWSNAIISTGKRIMSMYRTLNELQQRVADVAQCIDAIQKLQKTVAKRAPELMLSLNDIDNDDYGLTRENFVKKLLVPRFLKKSDYFYSRGHVLTMHLEIVHKKKTVVPLLQSVALLDAYCSIAQLYKESQNEAVTFSFPEFIDSEKPFLNYRSAWLPLLPREHAVTNDLFLGGNEPGKMIITGPNGSGKSTILKNFGVEAVLAQGWCIVPAQKAQQTLFTAITTNLAADENLQRGLSKGTAGLKAMDEILHAIDTSSGQRMLVLIDEPYAGMPDVEAAKRIYLFGKEIAQYSNVLVAIATHTKRPMQLAQDTAGIFANYQVKINEIRHGEFERLFKFEKGPALWWFEDEDRRSRFIDWLAQKAIAIE